MGLYRAELKGYPKGTGTTDVKSVADADVPLPVGTWAVAAFQANLLNHVTVSFGAVNSKDCEGCTPMVYIGATPPRSITQFSPMNSTLKKEWQVLSHSEVVMASKDAVYVAIGWNGTEASIGLDCIRVNIVPWD
jgi:hypothetical protein